MHIGGDGGFWEQYQQYGGALYMEWVWMNHGNKPLEVRGYAAIPYNNDSICNALFQRTEDPDNIQYAYTAADGSFSITGTYVKRVQRDNAIRGRFGKLGLSDANLG